MTDKSPHRNTRSTLLLKNIIGSFAVKGWSAIVVLLMVPLTLDCLGAYQNGVWLTISSLLVWIDQMDIGLGNGLRNRLAAHVAHDQMAEARKVVSSTMAMLACVVIPVMLILVWLIWNTDVYAFLNVEYHLLPELRTALTSAVVLVCLTFVMKSIGNVYMGMQLPAVNNLLLSLGQTVALVLTWLLYRSGRATFLPIVVVNTAAPLLVFMLAYPYTFYCRFPDLRPVFRLVNLRSALELGNLGIKFFWLQLAGLLQFWTANLLISHFFTPEMVTPYQIASRYIGITMVAFTVVCMPFWSATTDAYERDDMLWIRRASHRMNLLTVVFAIAITLMAFVSPWVYQVWIGNADIVPFPMTIMTALYIFLMILSMRYSYFLNGIGALRLQLYMTVMAVIFIPAAWAVSSYTHNIIWFMTVMCLCNIPGIAINMIQFHKILHGTAKGIWRK